MSSNNRNDKPITSKDIFDSLCEWSDLKKQNPKLYDEKLTVEMNKAIQELNELRRGNA